MRPAPHAPLVSPASRTARLALAGLATALLLAAPAALEAGPPGPAAAPAQGVRVTSNSVTSNSGTLLRGPALAAALKTKRLARIEFKDISLKDLVTWLRTATGWNWMANHAAIAKEGIDTSTLTYSADFDDLSVATLLDVLLEPQHLALRVHENLIWITTKGDAQGKLITRVYGISHITWQKIDFAAPDVHLNPSGFTAEEVEPETLVEDDPLVTGDAVAELLQDIVAPGDWQTEGWNIRASKTYLVVRAPAAVHAKIPAALDTISALK